MTTVGQLLLGYVEHHAPTVANPERIAYAIDALTDFWADKTLHEVTPKACRAYIASRKVAPGTVRRELGVLRAALNHGVRQRWIAAAPPVDLPSKPEPKQRWLTRGEAARLLWACRAPDRRHLARLILIQLYTGTRPGAAIALRWRAGPEGGWIDVERGLLFRAAEGARVTKKRKPPAKMPRQLVAHARRWRRDGAAAVISYRGKPVIKVRKSWAAACEAARIEGATPHTLRHTAITWAMQRGAPVIEACGYFGVSQRTMEDVYLHHHPEYMGGVVAAMERKR